MGKGISPRVADKDNPYYNGLVGNVSFVVGAEATNVINVGVQLQGPDYESISVRGAVQAYLSDDAAGDSVAATAPSGGLAIGTDGVAMELIADKVMLLVSETTGHIDINITEAGAKTFYLVVVLPGGGLAVSGPITFT